MEAELTVEGWAEVVALRGHFGSEHDAEVLARIRVTEAAWKRALADWPARIVSEGRRGSSTLAMRFARSFAAVRDRLAAEQPAIESLGPLPEPEGAAPDEPAPAPEPEAARLLAADPIVHPVAEASSAGPRSEARPSFMLDSPARSANASSSPWSIRPIDAAADPDVTLPPNSCRGPQAAPRLNSTSRDVLPFRATTVASEPHATRSPPVENARDGLTTELPAIRPDEDTLPFSDDASAAGPRLTLEQYASLSAQLSLAPERADHVLARWGIGDCRARRQLEKSWRSRFRTEVGLRDRFDELVAAYRDWLRRQEEEHR
jgi:hypothetical protein